MGPPVISAGLLTFKRVMLVCGQKGIKIDATDKGPLAKMNDGQGARVDKFIQFGATNPEIMGRI